MIWVPLSTTSCTACMQTTLCTAHAQYGTSLPACLRCHHCPAGMPAATAAAVPAAAGQRARHVIRSVRAAGGAAHLAPPASSCSSSEWVTITAVQAGSTRPAIQSNTCTDVVRGQRNACGKRAAKCMWQEGTQAGRHRRMWHAQPGARHPGPPDGAPPRTSAAATAAGRPAGRAPPAAAAPALLRSGGCRAAALLRRSAAT